MTKKIVDTFGAKTINVGVARDEVRRTVDPHEAAMEKLRKIGELSYGKPTVELLRQINRLALEAGTDVRDAKAGRMQ